MTAIEKLFQQYCNDDLFPRMESTPAVVKADRELDEYRRAHLDKETSAALEALIREATVQYLEQGFTAGFRCAMAILTNAEIGTE